jgi:hypothetical protein
LGVPNEDLSKLASEHDSESSENVLHFGQALVNLLLIQMDGRSTGSNSRTVQVAVRKKSLIQQELGKTRQEQL